MPETGDPRHPSSFKPQKTPAPLPNPANLNHGEQKGGGQSEQKHPVQSLQSTQEFAVALPSILLKSPLTLRQMIHLHRDQADVLAKSHRHQDVQEWSGDLDDSRA